MWHNGDQDQKTLTVGEANGFSRPGLIFKICCDSLLNTPITSASSPCPVKWEKGERDQFPRVPLELPG
jgi:hypothetical protein